MSAVAQTYTIPGATEQPAWVFPLWFEDGLGNKDTLYIGYDPEGQDFDWPQSDTVFGEKLISANTSIFNAYWDSGFLLPDVLKVVIWQTMGYGAGISFLNAVYPPLIMRWDPNLFYDPVIPYPNLEPLPYARGVVIIYGEMSTVGCSPLLPIIMTDTTEGGGLVCYASDSIFFTTGSLSGFSFTVIPWEPNYASIENNLNESDYFQIYPNPVSDIMQINNIKGGEFEYQIIDMTGNVLLNGYAYSSITINFTDYNTGIYCVNISTNNFSYTYKIIKL